MTASADDGNGPANTQDDNLKTRWSAHGDGQWISFDLGDVRKVAALAIAWHQGDKRVSWFDIQVSTDGTEWTTVVPHRTSKRILAQVPYDIPDVDTRYVRIVGHGNSSGNNWNSITEVDVLGAQPAGNCKRPAQVLDLKNWKITLPVDDPDQADRQPLEVTQPKLNSYALDPWFVPTPDCTGVRFRSAVDGVTTKNSKYPRSELREMNGAELAAWSSTEGRHTMVVDQTITRLPNDKQHLVVGQIHGGGDDLTVFRLEGKKLWVTNEDESNFHLITDDYEPGTRFQAKFEVSDGEIRAYYNGVLQVTIPKETTTAYFKTGAYTQANCERSSPCDPANYGEAIVHQVTVTHT